MRVTSKMINDQVIYNLNRSLSGFMRLQSMLSTGRRINTPSDDPIGTQKDLSYRKVLTEIAQFKKNTSSGLTVLSTYDTLMGDMKDAVSSAYEIAVALSNDTYDATARTGAATEVESLFRQMVDLANTQLEERYIFSGFRTQTKPLVTSSNGVEYVGDQGIFQVEVEATTKMSINMSGSDLLFRRLSVLGEDANLKVGVDTATLLADLHLGSSIDQAPGTFTVTDNNLGIQVTVDVSAAVTLNDIVTQINSQLTAGGITNLTADFGLEGNNLRWVSVPNGLVSGGTLLSNLNQGSGVDMSSGKIAVHTGDNSIYVEIDLSGASNINDVLNTINATLAAQGVNNVTAALNAAGTGIDITDSNAVPLGLRIDDVSTVSRLAADLGIVGAIDPVLSGTDLAPRLDFTVAESSVGETTASDLGLLGSSFISLSGQSLDARLTMNTPLSLLNNGLGFDLGQVKITKGRAMAYFDFANSAYSTVGDLINALNATGIDMTASINPAQTGIQIVPNDNNSTFIIEELDGGRTAHQFGIFGSSDLLGSMLVLVRALQTNDREVTGALIDNLNDGMQLLLENRAYVGAKVKRLETTNVRLAQLENNFTALLSEVEDADLTKTISDLSMKENAYQAALIASAKIIQPSLLDFLK